MDQLLTKLNISFEALSKKEAFEIQKIWFELFATKVKEKTGKYKIGKFILENFNRDLQPALTNAKAIEEYKSCTPEPIYIFNEGCNSCYLCNIKEIPELSTEFRDIYIFPLSKKWTMVYDHMGGAYFAKSTT